MQSDSHGCRRSLFRNLFGGLLMLLLGTSAGCYAPLCSPGIPAPNLPDSYRTPYKSIAQPLNFSNLTVPPPKDYILGPDDVLEVTVPDLFRGVPPQAFRVQVMANGEISLPLLKPVRVGGMNLLHAQQTITKAYASGVLANPFVNVSLAEKKTFDIPVVGEVQRAGVHALPKYENDVGHALAAAGGFTDDAADYLEVHRRVQHVNDINGQMPYHLERYEETPGDPKKVLRIPLRGLPAGALRREDVQLGPGDMVVVPNRKDEVFWVVGQLDDSNLVRFSLGDRERELGAGLILPRDRDIDVVTAVAMAGYIDPIHSPTTVTVHRTCPNGEPMLIHVDLIKARFSRKETVMVQPGDIVYVNPDASWWMRRTFDRIVPELLLIPYAQSMIKAIN